MEPNEYKKSRKLHYPKTPILFELACIICVLGVALYFILGASAHSAAPQASTTSTTSTTAATASPTTAATPSGAIPAWNGPTVHILSVTPDNSSAKISFQPVAGAKDYRIFDISDPLIMKYAGMAHLEGGPFETNPDGTLVFPFVRGGNGPAVIDVAYPQIEWNLLGDGQPHTLIVQAVNELGPIPPGNLYNNNNAPLTANGGTSATDGGATGLTLGMNSGPTPDGHISINGQGPSTDNPKVIAQSAPFVVQPDTNYLAIPSTSSDTQSFFDTFDNSEGASFKRTSYDPAAETATYTLNAGTNKAWTIEYQGADVLDSYPMIQDDHFMDVLFDGGTPGSNDPLHISHGAMNMIPDPIADFSNGKVLHITMEVDLHQDTRRWVGIELAPVGDPLTNLDDSHAVNNSDKAFLFNYYPGTCTADVLDGPTAGPGSPPNGVRFWGAAGQAQNVCDTSDVYWGGNGINLDNRGKLDLFLTQTQAALFINGQLVMESAIPGGLPFTQAKVYFTHYVYHTGNDINELQQSAPYQTFWINYYHWSDERHWDNMGFEVFPASAAPNVNAWQNLVGSPNAVAPQMLPAATTSGSSSNSAYAGAPQSTAMADTPKSRLF